MNNIINAPYYEIAYKIKNIKQNDLEFRANSKMYYSSARLLEYSIVIN